jgi:hypothetical protein
MSYDSSTQLSSSCDYNNNNTGNGNTIGISQIPFKDINEILLKMKNTVSYLLDIILRLECMVKNLL